MSFAPGSPVESTIVIRATHQPPAPQPIADRCRFLGIATLRGIVLLASLLLSATTAEGQAASPGGGEEPAPEIVARPIPAVLVSVGELLTPTSETNAPTGSNDWANPDSWTRPESLDGSVKMMLSLTVLSLAPAILLMTTCYVRIVIVLGLLRQAIGLQSLPPAQVTTSLALFMTLFVMAPVWTRVHQEAIEPYIDPAIEMSWEDAVEAGVVPIREFMSRQIDVAGNHDDVHLFFGYLRLDGPSPETFEEVPLRVLLPAFLISELKTAFLMGFQIYLPFLIVDLVVASVTISMGMLMLPPAVISLPLKLLLFVLVDGWRLVVQMLMDSFGTIG